MVRLVQRCLWRGLVLATHRLTSAPTPLYKRAQGTSTVRIFLLSSFLSLDTPPPLSQCPTRPSLRNPPTRRLLLGHFLLLRPLLAASTPALSLVSTSRPKLNGRAIGASVALFLSSALIFSTGVLRTRSPFQERKPWTKCSYAFLREMPPI